MKKQREDIINDFQRNYSLLSNFRESTELLVKSLFHLENINPHQVKSRLKDTSSLEKKIVKKNYKYNSLSDITDIVGIRVILYFEDEIDQIASVIEREFEVDQENSVDKRIIGEDKFGYRSLHYVASYIPSRLKLKEYSIFKDLKFEIQIRSILQHSWAEIEHDLGYKGENEIPASAKRTFYRVAALLEQADIEFVKLKNTISEYERNIDQKVKDNPSEVKLDKASLKSFLFNNSVVRNVENKIIESRPGLEKVRTNEDDYANDKIIDALKKLGINTISDLEEFYFKNQKEFLNYHIKRVKNDEYIVGMAEGASLIWMLSDDWK